MRKKICFTEDFESGPVPVGVRNKLVQYKISISNFLFWPQHVPPSWQMGNSEMRGRSLLRQPA